MNISLGDHEGTALFLDTDDNSLNVGDEFLFATTPISDDSRELLGDKCPPLTEAFKRYDMIVEALGKHDLTIEAVLNNMAKIGEDEADALQAEVHDRVTSGDFMQVTDVAVLISTRFGYVLGMTLHG